MKIWVTGESSGISKSFSDYCERTKKHIVVNSLSNDEYEYWRKDNLDKKHEIDTFDPTLENLISRSEAEVIVHAYDVHSKVEDYMIRSNVMSSYYVYDIAKKLDIPVIFISSSDIYKLTEDELLDSTVVENNSIYSFSKISSESIISMSNRWTVIVPGHLYGPHHDDGIITSLVKSHYGKIDNVDIPCDPTALKSFLYTDDFNILLDDVISNQHLYNRRRLNICNETYHSYEDVINILNEDGIIPEYTFKVDNDFIGIRKMKNSKFLTSWKPKVDLEKGIKKTIDWVIKTNERRQ